MAYFERRQVVLYVVASVMISGFVVFRYLPLRRRSQSVAEMKIAQRLSLAETQAHSEQLSVLNDALSELRLEVGDYDSRIPKERALGGFLQSLTDMMNKHGLEDQEIAPGEEIEVEGLGCIPLNLHCRGGLEQVFEFCRDLQGMDRLVRIEQVRLSNDDRYSGAVTLQTKAVVYYRKGTRNG